jgi:hypothetical protein
VLTPHERFTAPGVVLHVPRCRASARKHRCVFWRGRRPFQSAFASAVPASISAELRIRAARFVPPRRSDIHENHLAPIQIP